MATCPHCQSSMSTDADFCGHCGGRLDQGGDAPEGTEATVTTYDELDATKQREQQRKLVEFITASFDAGQSREEVIDVMIESGYSGDSAESWVSFVEEGTQEEEPATDEIVERYQVYVAKHLAQGGDRASVISALVEEGWPGDVAEQFVDNTQLALYAYTQSPEAKAERRGGYAKHIGLGALWAIGGAVVTLATYSAAEGGGTYIIAWGAMGIGALQFLYGLFGWLTNQ